MGETSLIIGLVIFNIMFIAFIGAITIFIREYKIKKKQHTKEVIHIEETHQQELLETQLEIQKQTMIHIGREIHDNVGQKMTLASLYLQQLEYENTAPELNEKVKNIGSIINQSLHDLRQLSKSLTDDTISDNTLYDLIDKECNKIVDLKIYTINFVGDESICVESYQKKSILFRITQEFLQNSIKHSNCNNINVSLLKIDETITLSLQDDGKGFDLNTLKPGIGLKNIKKRTELIGGIFDLKSNKREGTKLTIKIKT